MDITYQALPFPLPESVQKTLRLLAANVLATKDKADLPGKQFDYANAARELQQYEITLRDTIGCQVTRPEIRPIFFGQ
jgi:hypothetical protein